MTTAEVTQALERRAEPKAARTVLDLLERQKPQIEKALPAMIGVERFTRVVQTALRQNPELYECTPESLLGALMLSAQLGLEPGPLGHVYLVPFKKQVTFILGYKGMIDLARRSDRLGAIQAFTVYEGDGFEYRESERGPILRHSPTDPDSRGGVQCYYGRASVRSGRAFLPTVLRLWPPEVEAARKRSPLGRQNKGPWQTDYDAMAHKTCIRRMSAWLPMTIQFGRALDADESVADLDGEVEAVEATEGTESS